MDFSISVIMPAYNVEEFIENAIHSVINQSFVNEILVINDGSSDNTLNIVQNLKTKYSIIKILEHKNGVNKGRSASRNLGIKNARSKFIAFLDADDFFLEKRFVNDKKIYTENKHIDGIYNAVGFHFYRKKGVNENFKLSTISKFVASNELFEALISGKYGYFHINGLTLKRSIFEKVGYFNDKLLVAEDTDIFYKLALLTMLVPGILDKPVAMRGIHDSNVFHRTDLYEEFEIKMYESLFFWSSEQKLDLKVIERFLERIWIIRFKDGSSIFKYISYWFYLVINSPDILFTYLTLKYFPVVRQRKKLFPMFYKK